MFLLSMPEPTFENSPSDKYTESEAYQKEIAEQYKERVSKFSREQVVAVLQELGVSDAPQPEDLQEATGGNVHATYIGPKVVVKMNQRRENTDYVANKLVSDRLSNKVPVVKVLTYDNFEKTDFEVLVMERTKGTVLLNDIFELSEEDQKVLFEQVLDVVKQLFTITFNDFGDINLEGKESYATYAEFLKKAFDRHIAIIREDKLAKPDDIDRIEAYFHKHIGVFSEGDPVFVHTDLHMGNILHEGNKLTAVLDFDYSLKAPKVRVLQSLLAFIDKPQQFVEGTLYFEKYKGKHFRHLLPVLKAAFPDIFSDPQLVRKLNLIQINEAVMWVSQNWSEAWNKEMIADLLKNELPESESDLSQTYNGKLVGR